MPKLRVKYQIVARSQLSAGITEIKPFTTTGIKLIMLGKDPRSFQFKICIEEEFGNMVLEQYYM